MKIDKLWQKLVPLSENVRSLKKDLAEGKVPELPYFIVGQLEAKESIASKISDIDSGRMLTSLVIAPYGNGKTNLLKYLSLFFRTNKSNVKFIYSRADVDQPDLVLYLLKQIQDHYINTIVDAVVDIRASAFNIESLVNNYEDNFSAIREYVAVLFGDSYKEDQIKKIVYLGTGRLYSKANFTAFGLEQLNNFNRREVLVLLLNILAYTNNYVVFGIDEIEKIREKSSLRFNQFLTSYRELVDLSNKIHGHYLITCFTFLKGSTTIQEANDAFYSRIVGDIVALPAIEKREDILELVTFLNEIFETEKDQEQLDKIAAQLLKGKNKAYSNNRELMRSAAKILSDNMLPIAVDVLLEKQELNRLYDQTKEDLLTQDAFKSLRQKFFDPLEYYLEDVGLLDNNGLIERRTHPIFLDRVNSKIHYFIFNENTDLENLNKKLIEVVQKYNYKLVIYSPVLLELSNSSIDPELEKTGYSIVNYDPDRLFVLLNMYRDNLDLHDSISGVISVVTESNL